MSRPGRWTIALLVGLASAARADHDDEPPLQYQRSVLEPVRPQFALSANSDGTLSAKANVSVTWDVVPLENGQAGRPEQGKSVHSFTVAPTVSLTDASNAPLFSIGSKSASPNFGGTSVAAGVMGAWSLVSAIAWDESFAAAQELKDKALAACKPLCAAPIKFANQQFCETYNDKGDARDQALNYNFSEFCPDGQKEIDGARKKIAALQQARYRFPVLDVSLWLGGGASLFNYYLQTAPAVGATPAMFASKSDWDGHFGAAFQLTAVPKMPDASPIAVTIEAPLFFREGFQASKTSGQACKPQGALADGSSLSTCSAAQPVGAPKRGESLTAEIDLGVADRASAYWRVAFGVAYTHDWVAAVDTWTLKLPLYINATALGGGKDGGSGKPQPKTAVQVDYAGIVRLTPTFQTTSTASWSVLLNLELLGQRNLFTRADTLVK
jgi:hypothetical protein